MTAIASYAGSSKPIAGRRGLGWATTFLQLLGLFLVATAVFKAFRLADTAALGAVYDVPKWLLVVAVQAEVLVGAWLLSRLWPRGAWRGAAGLFAAFAAFSFYRGLAGFETCGCFGAIAVSPWWTFALDIAILGSLLLAWPSVRELRGASNKSPKVFVGAFVYVAMGVTAAGMMISQTSTRGAGGEIAGGGGLVILEPAEWIGRELPIADWISPKVDLTHGNWIVLIYHHDCPSCQEAVPRYEALADGGGFGDAGRLLLVEMPPYGKQGLERRGPSVYARLSDNRDWFVQTPIEIRIQNGKVTGASLDLPYVGGPH